MTSRRRRAENGGSSCSGSRGGGERPLRSEGCAALASGKHGAARHQPFPLGSGQSSQSRTLACSTTPSGLQLGLCFTRQVQTHDGTGAVRVRRGEPSFSPHRAQRCVGTTNKNGRSRSRECASIRLANGRSRGEGGGQNTGDEIPCPSRRSGAATVKSGGLPRPVSARTACNKPPRHCGARRTCNTNHDVRPFWD